MTTTSSHHVTGLLLAWGEGDDAALEQLTPIVYGELHAMARRYMSRERQGQTMQATALVHEAYLRLVDVRRLPWQNRAHFFALSGRLMRRILVDLARARGYQKRGGGARRVTLEEGMVVDDPGRELLALDDALTLLATFDERKCRVVEMRFFAGLDVEEIAAVLKVSTKTVTRDWQMAKAWLAREMAKT